MADFSNSVLGVSGASGYVGRAVIAGLKARGAKKIVAITRDPSKIADIEGVEARTGDFGKPETLDAAFKGIDRLLKTYNVAALVGPTMPPAWKIDAVNGDQISGGGAGSLAAVSGYPHLTVPMGLVKGMPVGLSFIGPKWSEALILSLGYSYEQARGLGPGPRFLPSIEEAPEIAPHLAPVRR